MGTFSQLALHKSVRNSILSGLSFPIFGLNTEIYPVRESTDQEKSRIRIFFMQYIMMGLISGNYQKFWS